MESKCIWSQIKRNFYEIEFINEKETFKPAGWNREWPDKQTLERNIYEGSIRVTSIDDGMPVANRSVPLSIAQKEFVWGSFIHSSEQTVITDKNGVASYKINPKSGAKFINVHAIIPVTEYEKQQKMIQSEEQTTLKSWTSQSDSYVAVWPQKQIFKCDENPEIKIQYNLLYSFNRFESADDAIQNLNLKYILTSGKRLLSGGDVSEHTKRNLNRPKFIQRGTASQILRGYTVINVSLAASSTEYSTIKIDSIIRFAESIVPLPHVNKTL